MKTVLLTGGSRGIGLAIKNLLIQRSYNVIAPTRSELDLSDRSSLENFIYNNADIKIDILINNAGLNILNNLEDINNDNFDLMTQVNVKSSLKLIQTYSVGMRERKWGRILNISSIFSLVTKSKRANYSMTKAALNALTRSAAVEYGKYNVIVNSLAPGYVDTDLTRINNTPESILEITDTIPLKRFANINEIAAMAAFLVSDENTYMTGQTLVIDGGFLSL